MEKTNTVKITVNWASVLCFVVFFMYGVFGYFALPGAGTFFTIGTSLLFLSLCVTLFLLRNTSYFVSSFSFVTRDGYIFLSYGMATFVLAWRDLFTSIDGDQLYHSQQAMMPSIFIVQILTKYFYSSLGNLPLNNLLWLVNAVLFFSLFLLCFFVKRFNKVYTVLLLSFTFLLARFLVIHAGGNGSAFPTFRLFPLWLSEVFFSPSSFGFRFATYFGLIILMGIVYYFSSKKLSQVNSYLLGLFVGTIPLLLHIGTLVEMSLWATICLVMTFFVLHTWYKGEKLQYIQIISSIVILSCMRVSGFLMLIPVAVCMLVDFYKKKISTQELFFAAIPVLVLLPVLLAGVYIGTPSSYRGEIVLHPYIEAHASLFKRLSIAVVSGEFFTNIYDSIRFPLIIFLLLLPILLMRNIKNFFITLSLFAAYFILFYSIEPGLWGHGRYQAEYVIPFIVYAVYLLLEYTEKHTKVLGVLVLCLLSMSNIYMYRHMSEMNMSSFGMDVYSTAMKARSGYFAWSQLPYNFKDALQEAKRDGYAGRLYYSPGNGYGYFAEILSGYTVQEMSQEKNIISKIGVGIDDNTAEVIDKDKDIALVLVNGSKKNKQTLNEKMLESLKKKGWQEWKNFKNDEYGTVIYGLKRF